MREPMSPEEAATLATLITELEQAQADEKILTWNVGSAVNGRYCVARAGSAKIEAMGATFREVTDNFAAAMAEHSAGSSSSSSKACDQENCEERATHSYIWPGNGQRYAACGEHAEHAKRIVAAMDLELELREIEA